MVKWGFVIVTLYTGPVGLVQYLSSCREPLPGTHEEYLRARWRRVVGSTMHCVVGDGLGILLAVAVTAPVWLPAWAELLVEYAAGWAASRCDTSSPSGSAKPVAAAAHRGLNRAEGLIGVGARVGEEAVAAAADGVALVGRELVAADGVVV